ncbi:hypothetical protein [Streptomyces sp. NRRL S-350]|uniref:hypothetical protein n=1 Tax=Streptomyces sp. NRRL S-350 TaxID=1463902 RepID=UPI0004BED1D9|nr:hypothetical protein [Streptomyces sp. NRRL S-350]
MSKEFPPADAALDDERAAVWALGELAGSVETGPVPYDRLVAGGRRRLRRRRLLTAGAAAVLVAAVLGAGAALGERGRQAVSTAAVAASAGTAASASASAVSSASASAAAAASGPASVAAATSAPARDPLDPVRVKVGEGTANGHTWQAWTALWPAAQTKESALEQARLIQAERHAANPDVRPVTQADVDRNFDRLLDAANLYYTVDGKRQAEDSVQPVSAPGEYPAAVGGASLGLEHGASSGLPPVVIEGVRPEVAKIVVEWRTGGSTEAVPVPVGDSPWRWYAVLAKPGTDARAVTSYAADGSVLGTDTRWLRTH